MCIYSPCFLLLRLPLFARNDTRGNCHCEEQSDEAISLGKRSAGLLHESVSERVVRVPIPQPLPQV